MAQEAEKREESERLLKKEIADIKAKAAEREAALTAEEEEAREEAKEAKEAQAVAEEAAAALAASVAQGGGLMGGQAGLNKADKESLQAITTTRDGALSLLVQLLQWLNVEPIDAVEFGVEEKAAPGDESFRRSTDALEGAKDSSPTPPPRRRTL